MIWAAAPIANGRIMTDFMLGVVTTVVGNENVRIDEESQVKVGGRKSLSFCYLLRAVALP
jgi:hypothetical protein